MIKAIFFDLDDTLYNSSRLSRMARLAALEGMINEGLPMNRHEGWKMLNGIVRERGSNYPGHLNLLLEKTMGQVDCKILCAGIVAYHNTKFALMKPFGDTVPTLITLRQKGKKLGIITNGVAIKQWEKILRLSLEHFFDGVFVSQIEGVSKPQKEIYKKALDAFEIKPKEAAMVDDRASDLEGARSLGMHTILKIKKERKEGADFSIRNLSDLIGIIGELNGK